ncbi:multidrug resistance-associated protein 1 isoform X2 [Microcaecilia unicolor]|uniref:ABC-type glutathione-S-conjugate transporter n=1 Tax=Microcaecilia unicolor TaxID=1415580 RepID=A0A6P7YB74_9AMPH|nr:multidrug resistance-associated protein 1-like isoform X2 [Microcaecilia unicolor]
MKCNPEKNASFCSKVTYSWYSSVITLGYKKPLEREDLFELNENDSAYRVCPSFEKHWRKEVSKYKKGSQAPCDKKALFDKQRIQKPSLLVPLWHTFKVLVIQIAVLKVAADILAFISPQILKRMIAFCESSSAVNWDGYVYSVTLLTVAALQTLVLQLYQRLNMVMAAKIKTAVIGLIYKKSLNLANSSRRQFTTGELVNLMSSDAQQLMDLTVNLHLLWSAPFQILMATIFLWQELGVSVLAGVAVLVLVIPINAFVASKVKLLKKSHLKNKDQRVKLLNEILHGIKILKLYAWEPFYQKKVLDIREREMDVLKYSSYLTAFSMLTLTCIPFLVSLATFGVYFLLDDGNILSASKVFTTISLFNILRLPLFDLPTVISTVVQTKVSLSRLENFLCEDELEPANLQTVYSGSHVIGFTNASFRWDRTGSPILRELNLKIQEGSLVAVVGQVGSGKSSLLSAILGEMDKLEGTVQRKGSVAYVSQQAWIQNAVLQENILFGAALRTQHYERVLEACALLPDLELLPEGDQTEIGERGVNLSGGQKQRVSLARAVYSDSDIYLLDDPLSAVDVHVARHLFECVIGPNGLLKGKTRVLVTHNLTVLPEADLIIVMEGGRLTQMGTYEELLTQRQNFTELLQTSSDENKLDTAACTDINAIKRIKKMKRSIEQNKENTAYRAYDDQKKMPLMKKEKVTIGNMKTSVVTTYLQAFGWFWVGLTVAVYTGQNAAAIGQNLWLSLWSTEAEQVKDTTEWQSLRNNRLGVYGLLGLVQGLLVCYGAYVLTRGTICASRALHHQMLDSILHLPLLFFESTPMGQVLNRFTKDIYVIDERFHYYLRTWLNCMLDVAGTILIIGFVTPLSILVIIPLGFLYFTIQRYYISSSRQIRRLDGASRSPVISHFSESLLGTSTIRAYGHQERFTNQNRDVMNENLVCYYNNVISNRWLAVRLEFLGSLLVFFTAFFAVLARDKMEASTVGLSITYALNITQTLNFWVRKACEIETNGVAIERVCEYAELEKEASWITSKRPPLGWPEEGIIEFTNYEARYRKDLGLALRGVTFQIRSKEKVGIVGRTGAGKSTLTNCLFRILERCSGKIIIDGIDIAMVGLHDLRSKLNIIPQDPVLFSGTLRMNLDPLEKHSDMELWEAVELCHLKSFVQGLPLKLDHEIAEGGENLSVGQRQLVCLARALLRKTKILVLDEATASIDTETDNLVQSTIRKEFVDCTVLTIAHRLHTIMDSERVLVLDSGRILEFDTPSILIQKKGSFSKMVAEAGIRQDAECVQLLNSGN